MPPLVRRIPIDLLPPETAAHRFSDIDIRCMRRALQLARRAEGDVEPNPMVGAVLAQHGQIVAEGYHQKFGQAHAEVMALQAARDAGIDLRNCDLYVTLEPCCHQGKTPPCTAAILQSPPARVVVAMPDPFAKVAGKGIAQLRAAGVRVDVGCLEQQARHLNSPFIKRVTAELPWVIAKWAQTIDGRIATATGHSQWISTSRSRKLTHTWRGRTDAVMVGIGTALADNPMLTARLARPRRTALRVVVDPRLQLPLDSKLVASARRVPVLVATSNTLTSAASDHADALAQRGVQIMGLPHLAKNPAHLDLRPLLEYLVKERSATNVFTEGGGKLTGSLLAQGLLDELRVFVAPRVMGDSTAISAVAGLSPRQVGDAPQFELQRATRIDDDVLLIYRRIVANLL